MDAPAVAREASVLANDLRNAIAFHNQNNLPSNRCMMSDHTVRFMVEPPSGVCQWMLQPVWRRLWSQLPAASQAEGVLAGYSAEARTEAASRLIGNHEAVFRDVINPSVHESVVGTTLSQPTLIRVPVAEDPVCCSHRSHSRRHSPGLWMLT